MSRAQTIQVFLPSGDPQGMRIASVPTRTVQVFEVPRKLVPDFLKRPESKHVGVYFLVGTDDHDNQVAYVGQTGDLPKRLKRHIEEKPFWNRVFVAVSLTNEWSQTHIAYLEWESIRQARDAKRATVENANAGSRPHTTEPLLADCEEYLDTIKLLLSTLSLPLMDRIKRGDEHGSDGVTLVHLSGRSCHAKGVYSTDGLLVLSGAQGRYMEPQPGSSYVGAYASKVSELAEEGVLTIRDDGTTVFVSDHLFTSPSGAASALYCSAANGRTEWRDGKGRTIGDMEALALRQGDAEGDD